MIKRIIFLGAMFLFAAPAHAGQGWYLLLPPDNSPNTRIISKRWEQMGAFDTAKECERVLAERQSSTMRSDSDVVDYVYKKLTGQLTAEEVARDKFLGHIALRWSNAACIASDDPRLK